MRPIPTAFCIARVKFRCPYRALLSSWLVPITARISFWNRYSSSLVHRAVIKPAIAFGPCAALIAESRSTTTSIVSYQDLGTSPSSVRRSGMPSRSLLSMYWNPNRPRTQSPPWPLAVSARSPHLFFQDNGDVMRWTSRPLVSRWIWQPSAQYAHVLVVFFSCHGL